MPSLPADLAKVIELAGVRQPTQAPTPQDWERLEAKTGLVFPSDYKQLISGLGKGYFGMNLRFENPADSYNPLSHALLLDHLEWFKGIMACTSLKFYPEEGGLVFVGHIDRHYFFYLPEKRSKNLRQLVWIDSNYNVVYPLDGSLPSFLYKLYMGEYPKLFPVKLEDLRATIWHDRPFFTAHKA